MTGASKKKDPDKDKVSTVGLQRAVLQALSKLAEEDYRSRSGQVTWLVMQEVERRKKARQQ